MLVGHIYSAGVGLSHRRHGVIDGAAHYVEGCVVHRIGYFYWAIYEEKPS